MSIELLFSFTGLVVASIAYSFPFMLAPIINALINFDKHLKDASYSLGKSALQTFIQIELPLIRPALITAIAIIMSLINSFFILSNVLDKSKIRIVSEL